MLGDSAVHRLYEDEVGDGMTPYTGAEFAARLAPLPLLHEPGERWHYGWGLDLVGLIIEGITGRNAPTAGSVGEITWGGAGGTLWWADPAERLGVVFLAHTPNPGTTRRYHRLVRALVLAAVEP